VKADKAVLLVGVLGNQPGHDISVNQFAVAKRELPQRPLHGKAELLIESNRCLVVGVNLELESTHRKPAFRQIDASTHKRRRNALTSGGRLHGHAQRGRVAATRVLSHFNSKLPQYFFTPTRNEAERAFGKRRKALFPEFRRRKRQLQGRRKIGRLSIDLTDLVDVMIGAVLNFNAGCHADQAPVR